MRFNWNKKRFHHIELFGVSDEPLDGFELHYGDHEVASLDMVDGSLKIYVGNVVEPLEAWETWYATASAAVAGGAGEVTHPRGGFSIRPEKILVDRKRSVPIDIWENWLAQAKIAYREAEARRPELHAFWKELESYNADGE